MTDNEIKEECLKEAGIDLGRYSHSELTEIKDAFRRYHNAKLNLLTIPVVVGQSEQLPEYELNYCSYCCQMTNHLNNKCQKH
jgi:hypothetical protein